MIFFPVSVVVCFSLFRFVIMSAVLPLLLQVYGNGGNSKIFEREIGECQFFFLKLKQNNLYC